MKYVLVVVIALMTLACLLYINGCQSKGTSSVLLPGNPTAPEFVAFSAATVEADSCDAEALNDFFVVAGQVSVAKSPALWSGNGPNWSAAVAVDSFFAAYDTVTNYWHVYKSHSDTTKGKTAIFADSIQFRNASGPVHFPDSATLVEIRGGMLLSITYSLTAANGKSGTKNHNRIWTISGVPGAIAARGDVVINGTGANAVNMTKNSCTFTLNRQTTFADVALNIAAVENGVCPTGGTITHAGSFSTECTTQNGSFSNTGNWTVTKTFDGTNVSILAQNTHKQWTYTGPCPPAS